MSKICPKCSAVHEKTGTFCSRKCANSRQWSDDHKARLSESSKIVMKHRAADVIKASTDKARSTFIQNTLVRFENGDIENMSPYLRKRRVMNEQNGCCLHCGRHEWNGKPLTLELDHIDGNNKNNKRENLRVLCPNCHSQTPTWKISGSAKKKLQSALIV